MLYLQITNNGDKNDMVSQMAHAKNLGEPFMAHLENLYNIPCCHTETRERLSNSEELPTYIAPVPHVQTL